MTETAAGLRLNESGGVHLWGSYDAPTTNQGLKEIAETVGPHLVFGIPDGELNIPGIDLDRRDWVVGNLVKLRDETRGIRVKKWGDYHDYDDMAVLDIGSEGLSPYDINFRYFEAAKRTAPLVRSALDETGLSVPFQVGLPGYRQYPTFAFGQIKGQLHKYQQPFAEALRHEVIRLVRDEELQAMDIRLQTEHPVETIATLTAWNKNRVAGKAAALLMGKSVAEQRSHMPEGLDSALHLICTGRFKGHPLVAPDPEVTGSFEPFVYLTNSTLQAWPKRHKKPAVVGALAVPEGGGLPSPKAQREIAAQFADIELPYGTRLAVGMVTPEVEVGEATKFYEMIDRRVDGPVTVAAPCGLSSLRFRQNSEGLALNELRKQAEISRRLSGMLAS